MDKQLCRSVRRSAPDDWRGVLLRIYAKCIAG